LTTGHLRVRHEFSTRKPFLSKPLHLEEKNHARRHPQHSSILSPNIVVKKKAPDFPKLSKPMTLSVAKWDNPSRHKKTRGIASRSCFEI
jgi:hypothetical protein